MLSTATTKFVSRARVRRLSESIRQGILRCGSRSSDYGVPSHPQPSPVPFRSFGSSEPAGLFSVPELKTPSDFMKLAADAMNKCNSLRDELRNKFVEGKASISSVQEASIVLFQLDQISREVCNVIDAAELCRSVHSNEGWRTSSSNAFTVLSDYIAELNGDTALYEALSKVIESTDVFGQLSEEQQRFALLLQAEFERDGIHLSDADRTQLRKRQATISNLESLFTNNITNSSTKTFQTEASWVNDIFPQHVVEAHVEQPPDQAEDLITISTDPTFVSTLTRYSPNPNLRKQIFFESNTCAAENKQVLDALRAARHESAVQQGFDSFSRRVLKDRMAKSPENVHAFLNQLYQSIKPRFEADMRQVLEAKRKVERIGGGDEDVMQEWDLSFYTNILKARDGTDVREVYEYLTVSKCIEALQTLVHSLFGIIMLEETNVAPTEIWDPAVRKFEFLGQDEEALGTLYLDLYPREGKYGHAAHFTVRCGCALSYDASLPEDFQRPIVALVCNFQPESVQPIMTHPEVETFFHEIGHAIHSLLSRTTFQHVSGTRTPMDFVEMPSQLMEHWAWNKEFLMKHLAREHHQTGLTMPEQLADTFIASRNAFSSIDTMHQIVYAKFDQVMFGIPTTTPAENIFRRLTLEHGLPYAEGTHWYTKFGHLVTYGGGYYSYLYSKAFADDIWHQGGFHKRPLTSGAGTRLWKAVLAHGGARDPVDMLTEFLGRPPQVLDATTTS